MGLLSYYVAVSEKQLEEMSKNYDFYEEALDDACNERGDNVCQLGEESVLIEFLVDHYAKGFDNTLSFSFKDVADRVNIDGHREFYLDVNSVGVIADKFNKFSDDEFRLRFNSTEFKAELEKNEFMRDIFAHLKFGSGVDFGDESYFQGLLNSFRKLSNFFMSVKIKKYVILFYDV